MAKWLFFIGFFLLSAHSFTQDKKIDKLEILYDQGYYAKVLRKSKKLLADPMYDYSGLPSFYKALALFRMSSDENWYARHPEAIDEAIAAYRNFMENEKLPDYIKAHYPEIQDLKSHLFALKDQFRERGYHGSEKKVNDFINNELRGIKLDPFKPLPTQETETVAESQEITDIREKFVVYAKSFIGVKYVWAGSDPDGFDCSGFTSYIHKKYGILIARTAGGQMDESKKLKFNEAQKGDLVFFGSGSNISHVGMVVSDLGEDITMIHASTSKGVIITDVIASSYWNPKMKGAGTYIKG